VCHATVITITNDQFNYQANFHLFIQERKQEEKKERKVKKKEERLKRKEQEREEREVCTIYYSLQYFCVVLDV